MIESLRTKLMAERRRNLVQEMEIRKEMGDAMLQQLMESEELRRWVLFIPLFAREGSPCPKVKPCQSRNEAKPVEYGLF